MDRTSQEIQATAQQAGEIVFLTLCIPLPTYRKLSDIGMRHNMSAGQVIGRGVGDFITRLEEEEKKLSESPTGSEE